MMVGRSLLVSALALASLCAPKVLKAQVTTPSAASAGAPQAVDPKVREFAVLHAALNVARDEYNVEIAGLHEVPAKAEAMDDFSRHVEEILTEHGTTRETYLQELFAISSDTAQREAFEKIIREIEER
jgi:hypothetical protein